MKQPFFHIKLSLSWKLFLGGLLSIFFGSQSALGQQQLCSGSVAVYQVDQNENNGNGTLGSVYTWEVLQTNFGGNIALLNASGNRVEVVWENTPAGVYTLEVTETNSSGCFTTQQLTVQLRNLPLINLEDRLVCVDRTTGEWLDDVVFSTGFNPSQFTFQWTKNGEVLTFSGPALIVNEAGEYSVTITNNSTLCSQTASAIVTVAQPLEISGTVGAPFDAVQYINIQVSGGIGPFEYSLNGNPYQSENVFPIDGNGLNIVSVKDVNGCDEIQTISLYALGYPKFFTPNSDGFNDAWTISGLPNPSKAFITIFDRYGKLIYQFKGNQPGWNGTFNGEQMPSTDYWFTLSYYDNNGVQQTLKSNFSLIR